MQTILIVLPIFAYALLAGAALAYVLLTIFPRARHIAPWKTHSPRRDRARRPPRSLETPIVDANQQADRHNE